MKAVLCGYGVVGKGVEILCANLNSISIEHVFVRKENEKKPYFTNELDVVCKPEIDIVFECLNGLEPAHTLVTKALQAGKHVITSNKALIATYLDTYLEICKETNATIQIEACVAGGIPFLDALLKLQRLEPILGYEGIFNGTSNYILDQMQKNNMSYQDALQQAKDKGYAEFDSTNDTEGIDVWYKAKIANALSYQIPLKEITAPIGISKITEKDIEFAKKHHAVIRHDVWYKAKIANALSYQIPLKEITAPIGISKITEKDIEFAKKHHAVIRHIALSSFQDQKLACIIAPAFYPQDHFLANVPENYNAQFIYAHSFSKLGYFGQGAGQLATAQAMVQNALDCIDHCIRLIHCEKQEIQSWHQHFDWIVRTKLSLKHIAAQAMVQNALDCIDHCIRLIHCEKQEIQSWHQHFDWIVRTKLSLKHIANQSLEQDIYLIKNQPLSVVQSIVENDKQAMIALWRISYVENH